MRILVTGANGFVGRASCAAFVRAGVDLVPAVRSPGTPGARVIGDVDGNTNWSSVLVGVDAVVHLVAVTHGRDSDDPAAYARYRRVNVDGTRALAEQAAAAGVRRFVLVSSIKVNGESSLTDATTIVPYTAGDVPAPRDNYGRSKLEAERCVQALTQAGAFESITLRPPLIYGPGQSGNLLRMMRWVAAGRPMPVAGVNNLRSLIYVGNLADALVLAATGSGTAPEALPIADIELSSAALIEAMALALAVPARMFRCPPLLLELLARHPRGRAVVERLCGSLRVDARAARDLLAWSPRVDLAEAMRLTVAAYRSGQP